MMMRKRLGWLVLAMLPVMATNAQTQTKNPLNWYNLDLQQDHVFGVSTEKAYDLLKDRTSKTVIVAVIDGGTDFNHEDLKNIIWTNTGEIANNGVDDDQNGYIDDVHGWNFIGGKTRNVNEDNLEMTRLYRQWKPKYENVDPKTLSADEKEEYNQYQKIKKDYTEKLSQFSTALSRYTKLMGGVKDIQKSLGKDTGFTMAELKSYHYTNTFDSVAVVNLIKYAEAGRNPTELIESLNSGIDYLSGMVNYNLNLNFDPRNIVGDNYSNVNEKFYGNDSVLGANGDHGTHVAGIIAGIRNNGLGINGVANNVKIMIVRTVPDGDERDKDVANAIRYAVDNGATVINMSFGKAYSPYKNAVDEAVKYAQSKNVLLVHAAGNDSKNTDEENNFPTPKMLNGQTASNWIEVGASTPTDDEYLVAPFSNYGKRNVDLFAPGYQIYSTVPDSKYREMSGTSMASPVVAGVAALIRSYFPNLTAEQVKQVLMESVVPVKHKVILPGSTSKKVKFKTLCKSKGIINVYNAVEEASRISSQPQQQVSK
jgi:subtilisin family serine protease